MAEKGKFSKGKTKAPVIQNKKTMNFARHESKFNLRRVFPLILLAVIAVLAFAKVGILDLMEERTHAYDVVAYKQAQLAASMTQLDGYAELEHEYGRYSYGWMNDSEIDTVNRMDILELIEQKIAPAARVANMSVNNNVLTLNIADITLEQASIMVMSLEQSPLVVSATLHNAIAADAEEASISMSIVLTKEAAE